MQKSKKRVDEDLAKIEKLHEKDQTAAQNKDYKTLRSIMSDEAVIMPPEEDFIKGKEQIDENFEKMASSISDIDILAYKFDFHEVIVCGEYAIEYGTVTGKSQVKNRDEAVLSLYKIMRILRKEGSEWKIYRTIWNDWGENLPF